MFVCAAQVNLWGFENLNNIYKLSRETCATKEKWKKVWFCVAKGCAINKWTLCEGAKYMNVWWTTQQFNLKKRKKSANKFSQFQPFIINTRAQERPDSAIPDHFGSLILESLVDLIQFVRDRTISSSRKVIFCCVCKIDRLEAAKRKTCSCCDWPRRSSFLGIFLILLSRSEQFFINTPGHLLFPSSDYGAWRSVWTRLNFSFMHAQLRESTRNPHSRSVYDEGSNDCVSSEWERAKRNGKEKENNISLLRPSRSRLRHRLSLWYSFFSLLRFGYLSEILFRNHIPKTGNFCAH